MAEIHVNNAKGSSSDVGATSTLPLEATYASFRTFPTVSYVLSLNAHLGTNSLVKANSFSGLWSKYRLNRVAVLVLFSMILSPTSFTMLISLQRCLRMITPVGNRTINISLCCLRFPFP